MNLREFCLHAAVSRQSWARAAAQVQDHTGFTSRTVKARNKSREVLSPAKNVLEVQRCVARLLNTLYTSPDHVHGYVKGRNIRTNATPHCGARVVVRVDLKDFYTDVTAVKLAPELASLGVDAETWRAIEALCLVDGSAPAGFATSPVLSNIAFQPTDVALREWSKRNRLCLTRYADDICFSGEEIEDPHVEQVQCLLAQHDWSVNQKKTRFMRRGGPQFVTGLYVGDESGPRIPSKLRRRLETELYYLKKFGFEDCQAHHPRVLGRRRTLGLVHYVGFVQPTLLARLEREAASVDFDLPQQPEAAKDWDAILDGLGIPRDK